MRAAHVSVTTLESAGTGTYKQESILLHTGFGYLRWKWWEWASTQICNCLYTLSVICHCAQGAADVSSTDRHACRKQRKHPLLQEFNWCHIWTKLWTRQQKSTQTAESMWCRTQFCDYSLRQRFLKCVRVDVYNTGLCQPFVRKKIDNGRSWWKKFVKTLRASNR